MILNMFIAIMGDTFERNIENKQLNNVRAKLELMGEQQNNIIENFWCSNCCSKNNKEGTQSKKKKNFLFVVTPDQKDKDDLETWEGSIKQMSKLCQGYMDQINFKLAR